MTESPANISVVLPTYQRCGPLEWSIASVLKQRLPDSVAGARLVIINNDKEKARVDRAVKQSVDRVGKGRWDVRIVHRDPPMYPVYSWYEGIREFTNAGDLVFLHGDDDLMLPGSIAARVQMMQESDAHFLLTGAASGLFFLKHDGQWRTLLPREQKLSEVAFTRSAIFQPNDLIYAPFISNHAYRHSAELWSAYDATLKRMESIPVDNADKFAMLPQFLPIPLADQGLAFANPAQMCIRGMQTTDLLRATFGQMAWTKPGFYCASCLYVLRKSDLQSRREFDLLMRTYRDLTLRYLPSSLGIAEFRRTGAPLNLGREALTVHGARNVVEGVGNVLKAVCGVNALKLRLRLRRERGVDFDSVFSQY